MVAFQLTALVCFVTAFEVGHIDAFRSDYSLIEPTYSYYKLYSKANWTDAKAQCESDGATMFHPNNEAELLDVFRVLNFKKEIGWMYTGMTNNLDSPDVFKTVDGRLERHVYNKWDSGEPLNPNERHCVILYSGDHTMWTSYCTDTWPFICKHTAEIKTTLDKVERQVINNTAELETLEKLTVNQTGEIEALKQRMQQTNEYHFSILERLMEAYVNQSAALEQISKADTKQAADIKIQMEAMKHLIVNKIATEKP